MVVLPPEVKDVILKQKPLPIATADNAGNPNVVFIGMWKFIDDESIIVELVEEFDLEPVNRLSNVDIVEIDQRELLALRGELDTVNEAHDYMMQRLHELQDEFKSPWVNPDD